MEFSLFKHVIQVVVMPTMSHMRDTALYTLICDMYSPQCNVKYKKTSHERFHHSFHTFPSVSAKRQPFRFISCLVRKFNNIPTLAKRPPHLIQPTARHPSLSPFFSTLILFDRADKRNSFEVGKTSRSQCVCVLLN